MTLGITIRMDADTNTLTVDRRVFDRSAMEKTEANRLRRLVTDAFRKVWQPRHA